MDVVILFGLIVIGFFLAKVISEIRECKSELIAVRNSLDVLRRESRTY